MKIRVTVLLCMLLAAYNSYGQAGRAETGDTISIWVNGACEMCKTRIENAALDVKGVQSAQWNQESHQLKLGINPDKYKARKLHYKMASVGHDTRLMHAPDPIYEALPQCCKYRDHSLEHHHETGEITGKVFESTEEGSSIPLVGANIYWAESTAGTSSDQEGHFSIGLKEGAHFLVVSFVGYSNDTLHLHEAAEVEVEFSRAVMLEEVQVIHRIKPTSMDFNSAFHVQNIHEKELTKAACCNLSESFETNPSVDAGFTDAVTGTRKIEMLGLAGPYVQITRENMPDVRGLSALNGLSYTPGSWIQGIQLNMGAGSVVNGFESITGQINVELRKPEDSDRLLLNLYGNSDGGLEGNFLTSYHLNEKWSGSLLLHGNSRPFQQDHNRDGFVDHPTGNKLVALKRFKYSGEKGVESQMGVKLVWFDQIGGQMKFDPETPRDSQSYWGSQMNTRQLEGWAKLGKVFQNKPYASMGFQLSGKLHRQDAYFGLSDYLADHQSIYSNLIYQSILGSTNHQYRTGVSFQADTYDETVGSTQYLRKELVPGAFLEYTFNHLDLFTAVAGIRADYHSIYGSFFTPRLHLRYEPIEKTVFKASAGRGQKTASVFAENIGIFASSRNLFLDSSGDGDPYGLDAEVAWSYGLNLAQGFKLGAGESILKLDYYHTRFQNQVVVDLDRNPQEVHFYNLEGHSWSNSVQAQLDMEPLERYDIRIAYRLNDVQTTYGDELLPRPLVSKHRAFVNMAYATLSQWSVDLTWSWQGSSRIPNTASNPEPYRLETNSPAFSTVNLQLGKAFLERLDIYVGIENLLDFIQEDPILASDDPFGPWFDSSLIWGPVYGRKFYAGLRFRIN